jgi:hypothetical protein
MSKRLKNYRDMLAICRNQSTGWLQRCHAEPSPWQNAISRLAVRTVLRERNATAFVEVSNITEYGLTQRLSHAIRVF